MAFTPHEMPNLLDLLIQAQVATIQLWKRHPPTEEEELSQKKALYDLLQVAESPAYLFIEKDLCRMVADIHDQVPEWSLSEVLPYPHGFMVWEKAPVESFLELDEFTSMVKIDAVAWASNPDGSATRVQLLSTMPHCLDRVSSERKVSPLQTVASVVLPVDRPVGQGLYWESNPDHAEVAVNSAAQLLSALGTTFLLLGQLTVSSANEITVERKARPDKVAVTPRSSTVSAFRLNATLRTGSQGGGQGRKATKRWWVRSHWRQQAYGEGRKLRRPIFILPFTAGKQDAPIQSTIRKWKL